MWRQARDLAANLGANPIGNRFSQEECTQGASLFRLFNKTPLALYTAAGDDG
jgi:hypothetical protein